MKTSSMAKGHLLIYPNRTCQFFILDQAQKISSRSEESKQINNQLRKSFYGLFFAVNHNNMRIE